MNTTTDESPEPHCSICGAALKVGRFTEYLVEHKDACKKCYLEYFFSRPIIMASIELDKLIDDLYYLSGVNVNAKRWLDKALTVRTILNDAIVGQNAKAENREKI